MANYRPGIIFVGMETSGMLRRRFQAFGFETYSVDILPSEDGGESTVYSDDGMPVGRHIQGDIFETLDHLWAQNRWPVAGIFHPTCTFLTSSAEWAYKDGPYHQKVKPGTLVGKARREARETALNDFRKIIHLEMFKVIENPVGKANTKIAKPAQIIQPYIFGDDASKKTCLWIYNQDATKSDQRIIIDPSKRISGRKINGLERWGNQTDSNQNRLTPGENRWKDRSRTYPGIADAIVNLVSNFISSHFP